MAWLRILPVSCVISLALPLDVESQESSLARGQVIDLAWHSPIGGAQVFAFGDIRDEQGGECPSYANRLSATRSREVTGEFSLRLPQPDVFSFATVICADGYVPRIDEIVEVRDETGRLSPTPFEMWSYERNQADLAAAFRAKVLKFESDMRYLFGIEGGSEASANVFETLIEDASGRDESHRIEALSSLRAFMETLRSGGGAR